MAGGGRFPILIAESARRQGYEVIGAGHRSLTFPETVGLCARFRYFRLGQLGAVLRYFRREGVRQVTWAGWVRKEAIFGPWRIFTCWPDWRMFRLFYFQLRHRNRQDHTLLGALAEEFETEGIHLMHSAEFCPDLLAVEGVWTRRAPSRAQLEDIRFGWKIAKRMADLDVGQSVVVAEKSTIAVEGIEGTDRNIRRAGEYVKRGGFTVIKLAKDSHDMRFDIPTIGPETVETLHAARGAVLAVEAGRTLVLDRELLIEKANRLGIVVVAYKEPPPKEG